MSEWQEVEYGRIPKEWGFVKIIDLKSKAKRSIAMGPFGSNIKAENFVEDGVPVIRGTNLNGYKFVDGDFVFLTNDKADDLIGSNCVPGDLVFTHRGTLGQVGLIPSNEYERYVISQSGMKLTVDRNRIRSDFLFYFFISKYGQYQLLKFESQVGVPSISNPLTSLKSIKVPVPRLREQKAIAELLTSIDEKIDLLHRQNETLEAMAQVLFRQWFMEVESVDLHLDDFIEINPRESIAKGHPSTYLEMKNVETNTSCPTHWYTRGYKSGTKFRNGDAILARITPCLENGKKAYVQFLEDEEIGWGSTEYLIFRTKAPFHPFTAYLLAANKEFKKFAEKSMTGSSGRQRVQTNSLWSFQLGRPSEEKLQELNETFDSISKKIGLNHSQIQTLEKLRDTLLPKLMSGEIRVKLD